ncbi:hypothetical protein [Streptomyces subrutilus]|uniref:hypothetical protein n=1 Tax=Streptomyces subrutilus TaxID=36818 RepID=UPI0033EE0604
MDWTAPLSTLIGAAIGIASTLFADRARANRDDERQWNEHRREIYADFLAAISTAAEAMRTAALAGISSSDLEAGVREGYRASDVESARERVRLAAPPFVVEASTELILSLEQLRDRLATGLGPDSPEHGPVHWAYWAKLHDLRQAMRKDMGLEEMKARMSSAVE